MSDPQDRETLTPEQRETRTAEKAAAALALAQREDRVVALRLAGWSFDRIAVDCHYANRGSAQKAWQRAVNRIPERHAKQAKTEAVDRCLHMISVWLPRAADGEVDADRRLLAWEERLAKLQGTDAPTRVLIPRGPVDEAIEELCAQLAAMPGAPDPNTAG